MVLLVCIWPLRLPRYYLLFLTLILAWLALSIYSCCIALFAHEGSSYRTKWWGLAVPLFVYVGFNLSFTPVLLFAGFRALDFNSSAMQPTLYKGDHFLIDKDAYRKQVATHNDLVVMKRENYLTVKRVIAVGGETIQAEDRKITVNGAILDEPFIEHLQALGKVPELDTFGPMTVPPGKFFVMGDNRDVSLDSREQKFGFVDASAIVGRPLYIYLSPRRRVAGKPLN